MLRIVEEDWGADGLCRRRGLELYDLDNTSRIWKTQQAQADEVCFGCPVLQKCAADALRCRDFGVIRAATALPNGNSGIQASRQRLAFIAEFGRTPVNRDEVDQWIDGNIDCQSCGEHHPLTGEWSPDPELCVSCYEFKHLKLVWERTYA